MITLQDYRDYTLQIATRCKAIGHVTDDATKNHYTEFYPEDILTELKNIKSPVLASELPVLRPSDGGSDNIFLKIQATLLIVRKVKQGDKKDVINAYNEMNIIAVDILTKIVNDRNFANSPGRKAPEKYLKNFNLNEVRIIEAGPVFDGYYGWQINFPFNSPESLIINPDKWTDEVVFNPMIHS